MTTNEQIKFKLIQMPCCGQLLCWVNPRLPNFCPECGKSVFLNLKADPGGCFKIVDNEDMHFHTEADLTPEQAEKLLANLQRREQEIADIFTPAVYLYTPTSNNYDQVKGEIVEALGGDVCPDCFAEAIYTNENCATCVERKRKKEI